MTQVQKSGINLTFVVSMVTSTGIQNTKNIFQQMMRIIMAHKILKIFFEYSAVLISHSSKFGLPTPLILSIWAFLLP